MKSSECTPTVQHESLSKVSVTLKNRSFRFQFRNRPTTKFKDLGSSQALLGHENENKNIQHFKGPAEPSNYVQQDKSKKI